MSGQPTRPGAKPEVSEDEEKIIRERLKTFDEDAKTAVDAREAIASIRRNLKTPQPR